MEGGFASCSRREKTEEESEEKDKKYIIPGHTADFMDGKNTYRKQNGVWKQTKK